MTRLSLAALAVLGMAVAIPAHAQLAAGPIYDASARLPTGILGVTTFPERPAGFDAARASDEQLALYGMPPRPRDPVGYARWAAAMAVPARKSTEPMRAMPWSAGPIRRARQLNAAPSTDVALNWSGVVRTPSSPARVWSPKYSIAAITAEMNVTIGQQAFASGGGNICDGQSDVEVSWVGIDGYRTDDVLQGGALSGATCSGGNTHTGYCAWAEWFPWTDVTCAFTISAGDDLYVEVWDTSASSGYVYLLDKTSQVYTTVALTAGSGGPAFQGNCAEWIVERVEAAGGGALFPLTNYITQWWSGGEALTFNQQASGARGLYPGDQTPQTTIDISMVAPGGVISSATRAGAYGLTFQDSGCAMTGGC